MGNPGLTIPAGRALVFGAGGFPPDRLRGTAKVAKI